MIRTLGKYELLEELGHGGMATVYRARDTLLDRAVAIKVLHPHLQKTQEARTRFAREARSVARLKHPNILEVYEFSGNESEESYIAVELLTGPTLKHYIEEKGAMPAEIAACAGIQLCRALEAAHEASLVHRDVKPENVLFHEERCLKLTDFGIAQMVDTQSFTATGQILGSPGHMAPEQVDAGDVDERSDLFSLGTVLYYIALGRLPFTGRNPHQIIRRLVDGEFPPPLRVRPEVGERFASIIERCLKRNPDERYESAASLRTSLEGVLREVEIEDANAQLQMFLADPDGESERLRSKVIAVSLGNARAALSAKNRSSALLSLNRVLAIDDGNDEALRLIERSESRGKVMPALALACGVAVLSGAAWMGFQNDPSDTPEDPVVLTNALVDAALDATDDGAASDSAPGDTSPRDAGLLDAVVEDSAPGTFTDSAPSEGTDAEPVAWRGDSRRPGRAVGMRREDSQGAPREVVFRPRPPNVQISVDNGPLRAFGPDFRSVELTPGPHRFRFVGANDCCEDAEFTQNIPAGEEPYALSRALSFRDSPLYITANVPATVEVLPRGSSGGAEGRTRALLYIPMSRGRETRQYRVTAPGYEVYTGTVTLTAGATTPTQTRVELRESPP